MGGQEDQIALSSRIVSETRGLRVHMDAESV